MYSIRAAVITFSSLTRKVKVCRRNPSDFGCSVEIPSFVRNFRTATETEAFYDNFDGNIAENQSSYLNRNRNDQFYVRNLGGFELNQNPSRVYGQTDDNAFDSENGQNQLAHSSDFESRLNGRDIFGDQVNQIPDHLHVQNFGGQLGNGTFQHNVVSNGYGNGGILDRTQNGGRVYPENSRGGSYGGKEDVPVRNVGSADFHQQNVAGGYYSNAGDYPRSFSASLGNGTCQYNVISNGYGNGGSLDTTPQNVGRVYPDNSRAGSYGGKENVTVRNVDSAGVHHQNVAGGLYSNARDYPRSLSESQIGVGMYSPVGIVKNKNPSRVYGKFGTNSLDIYSTYGIAQTQPGYKLSSFYSQLYGRNIASGEVNLIRNQLHGQNYGGQQGDGTFQPNISPNGYVNRETLDRMSQNGGRVYPENSRGGSYGGKEHVPVRTQDYPKSLSESQIAVGIEQNQNLSRVYGKIGNDTLDLYSTYGTAQKQPGYKLSSFYSQLYGRNVASGEVNLIRNQLQGDNFDGQLGNGSFQQNVSSNGYVNRGTLDRRRQNGGGVYPENLRGGSFPGEEGLPLKSVDSAGVHPQYDAGSYFLHAEEYPRSLSEFQSGIGMYSPVGSELNQNSSRFNRKIGTDRLDLSNTFGSDSDQNQPSYNSVSFDSRLYARHIVQGEVNRNPNPLHGQNFGGQLVNGSFQQNLTSNGFTNGGILDRTPQNGGRVYQENQRGDSYGGKEDVPVRNVDSAGVHQQNVAGGYYSNTRDYPRSLSEFQNGVGLYSPVGIEQNQNPSRVYGKIGNDRLDLYSIYGSAQKPPGYKLPSFYSQLYGRTVASGEVKLLRNQLEGENFDVQLGNSTFQQNVSSNGYFNGGTLDRRPQNGGRVHQENGRGDSYGGNEMPVKNVDSAGVHTQNVAGSYYSNAGDYPRSLIESQSGVGMYSPVVGDVTLNTGSVEVVQESQSARTLDDLNYLTREGRLKEALELLGLLEKDSFQVELPQYMALVKACGKNEALAEAKSVHEHLVKSKVHLKVWMYNEILEMYSKCGSMEDAIAVFDEMPDRDMTSWDIMIYWLAKNGHGEESLELFSEFKQSGLKPDGHMFHGVFTACGVVCDYIEGMLQFESMMKDYGIVPSMEHYLSIVDMLGNAGCLDEALEFIQKMPVKPSLEIWETLMKVCRIHGNTVLGDQCAELVQLLDPVHLDEQSREGLIPLYYSDLEREEKKSTGDRSHHDNDMSYGLLRGLQEQMKEIGYVPELKCVLHDVDHESKEEALMAHSERHAAVHSFLTSPARSTVRIIKNHRFSSDSHNAFKFMSKIVGREIVARDSKRFHHFKDDGSCSCGDFW